MSSTEGSARRPRASAVEFCILSPFLRRSGLVPSRNRQGNARHARSSQRRSPSQMFFPTGVGAQGSASGNGLLRVTPMFEGFATHNIRCENATIHCRVGGQGEPLLLLHGFPQTHVQWHRLAPLLVDAFTLVIPDLRGYGASRGPAPDPQHINYSKREMAKDMVNVMSEVGHDRFGVVSHDRGARVGVPACTRLSRTGEPLCESGHRPNAGQLGGHGHGRLHQAIPLVFSGSTSALAGTNDGRGSRLLPLASAGSVGRTVRCIGPGCNRSVQGGVSQTECAASNGGRLPSRCND